MMVGIQFIQKKAARWFASLILTAILGTLLPVSAVVQAGTPDPQTPDPVIVQDLRPDERSSSPNNLMAIGNVVFFSANDGLSGREIWKTAPPYKSEQLVADVCPGGCSSEPTYLTPLGNTLFFAATDNKSGRQLWRSEPPYTPATTFPVTNVEPEGNFDPWFLTPIGQSMFYTAVTQDSGRELWRSDAPYTSAVQVADLWPGSSSSNPGYLRRIGWMLFYDADDSTGREVWRTDPPYTRASTIQQTDINPNGSSAPAELTAVGLRLFFSANDGESGQELYLLEPPYNEARRITDVAKKPFSSNPRNLFAIGDTLFFSAALGPTATIDILGEKFVVNVTGEELYKSSPPYEPTSTVLVKDVDPTKLNGSFPRSLAAIGGALFFVADDGKHGFELWHSEPGYLPDTTSLVLDIRKGSEGSNPAQLTPVGTTLFFVADDGVYGRELWKSEPPYDDLSTEIVMDLYGGSRGSMPENLLVVDRTLFFSATHGESGTELFRYGGAYAMPATGFAPDVITRVRPQPEHKKYQAMDELALEIPAIGVQTGVVGVPVSADGWDLSWLGKQTGYLSGTAYPTWQGNSVLTGHVALQDGQPGPFAGLSRLTWGDAIVIKAYGQRYRYEVRSVESIDPQDTDAVFQHEERAWLTLVTCQGYDEKAGSYQRRLVVRAVLVKVE